MQKKIRTGKKSNFMFQNGGILEKNENSKVPGTFFETTREAKCPHKLRRGTAKWLVSTEAA